MIQGLVLDYKYLSNINGSFLRLQKFKDYVFLFSMGTLSSPNDPYWAYWNPTM